MKRLFIALPLPKEAQKALVRYRDEMGRETPACRDEHGAGRPYLRWTPAANLHVTALFLGDVVEENVPRVAEEITRVSAATPKFSLTCGGACYAPSHRAPTMVWLTFAPSRPFSAFVEKLAAALATLAPAMDWKPWKAETPHVTLARFQRKVLPERPRRLRLVSIAGSAIPISSCMLMESTLTPAGPLYRVIGEYELTS